MNRLSTSFDLRFLKEADVDFVIVSDSHDCPPNHAAVGEFPSRAKQRTRADAAFRAAAGMGARYLFHLGDLVQLYPGAPGFEVAFERALVRMEKSGFSPCVLVPGNHDVGDKPDATMPTHPVTDEALAFFHHRFGPSYRSIDAGKVVFITLNSQVMGSGLAEEARQHAWLVKELGRHRGRRIIVLLHLPPYIKESGEPATGHYDNLDRPSRRALLALLEKAGVALLVAGHVHHRFENRFGGVRLVTAPSPAFTRPGYGHLFASPPRSERGRDDRPKLGFLYGRVRKERLDLHFLRTDGAQQTVADAPSTVVTPLAGDLARSPLGIDLLSPLSNSCELPAVFPAIIRQPARNDYPLLACEELGIGQLRVTVEDLRDPGQRMALERLRSLGVRIVAWQLACEEALEEAAETIPWELVDEWGLCLPGGVLTREIVAYARKLGERGLPVSWSPVFPFEPASGKQHPRPRMAFRCEEIAPFLDLAAGAGLTVSRLVVVPQAAGKAASAFPQLGLDVLLHLGEGSEPLADRVASLLLQAACFPGLRIYLGPLVELDRTMDCYSGLLDPLQNPTPLFHVARMLNAILFSDDAAAEAISPFRVRSASGKEWRYIPRGAEAPDAAGATLYRLQSGSVETMAGADTLYAGEPLLIETTSDPLS
ncbi:MAG TPA: metallophosphoesterase [Chthoniobacteraceae bacterium]|nr:metallophosphoesterase [Chthoniobacteraceae bacterium]